MPDLPPFDPAVHQALLTPLVAPKGDDPTTHHLDSRNGRSVARCGTQAVRLSLNWALVNCDRCRAAGQQPTPASGGRCPVGYRFRVGEVLFTVVGHREVAFGQVGCDVEGPGGVRQWVASEYIHEHGKQA
ncbi:hypothetical protein [Amycolatopsis speibonae]|uniref:Uncharacterized protein n=1 Tax=Amycolatopsis speibonae TaxID=1450224 RepID=A0ABV7P7V8_9PSEU